MISSIKDICSPDDPDILLYRTLKKPLTHRRQGVFIVEGDKVVRHFLQSSLTAVSVLLTNFQLDLFRSALEQRSESINVFLASAQLLKEIVGFRYHQGIMAAGIVPENISLQSVALQTAPPRLFVALDRLESAENTGVIVRNCAAYGAQALLIGPDSTDPYLRRAVRNSMGAIFILPVVYASDLPTQLKYLRDEHDFCIIAAHPREESVPLQNADLRKNLCIVFGNEGVGISDAVLNQCDMQVQIPMSQGIDSLNVASSSAVFLYETLRQRSGNEQQTVA